MKFTRYTTVALTCTSVAAAASVYASHTTSPELERVASETVRTAVPDTVMVCPAAPKLPTELAAGVSSPAATGTSRTSPAATSTPTSTVTRAEGSQTPGTAAVALEQVRFRTTQKTSPASTPSQSATQQPSPSAGGKPQTPDGPQSTVTASPSPTPTGPRVPVDTTVQTVRLVGPKARGGAPQAQLIVPSRKDGKAPAVVSADVARSGEAWVEQVRPSIFDRSSQTQPIMVSAASDGQERRPLGGVALSLAVGGDLRGMTTAGCIEPRSETWLVGGTVQPGSTSRLVVTNPSKSTSSVSISLFTDTGLVEPTGGQRLVLAAGTSKELLLGGLVSGAEAVTVRVRASDAPVAAYISTQQLDGLVPHGVSIVSPSVEPAERVIAVGPRASTASAKYMLRLVNPHDRAVVATWQGISDDGIVDKGDAVTVDAQSSVDVDLGSGASVASTVIVEGEKPVTAALRASVRTGKAGDEQIGTDEAILDHAWFAAGQVLPDRQSQMVVVPQLGTSKVNSVVRLAAARDAKVRWLPLSADGVAGRGGTVTVGAKRVVNLPRLPRGSVAAVLWAPKGQVSASVVASHPSIGVAGYPVAATSQVNVVEAVRPVPPGVMP